MSRKDGYLYDPPSWKVCPDCGGTSWINHYKTIPCKKCKGKGIVPIHYTPEQWAEAGGVLTDNMPVYYFTDINKWAKLIHKKGVPIFATKVIIATSAGKPKEK